MPTSRHRANRLADLLVRAFGGEAGAGLLLIAAAGAAMLAANSPLHDAYEAAFHGHLPWTPIAPLDSLHHWINDGLMAVFFFVVGLEIKREVVAGELSDGQRRRLPVLAAAAGMAVPAACYLAIAGADPQLQRGWAIPAATDIAFALGVLALVGKRAPPSLRLFLLSVAIVDDLGAVAIIALFYTDAIAIGWLMAALGAIAALLILGHSRVASAWPFVMLSVALWFCVLHSGVHSTVAGVVAALTIPLRPRAGGDSLLLRFEHALAPWNAYLVVPLFGLANAGVVLSGESTAGPHAALPVAIAIGLFLGKQVGIFGAIFAADRLGFAPRPAGASWPQLWGVAGLCGIGFTMSLFIGALAFAGQPALEDAAKLGVLAGSLLSAALGFLILQLAHWATRSH